MALPERSWLLVLSAFAVACSHTQPVGDKRAPAASGAASASPPQSLARLRGRVIAGSAPVPSGMELALLYYGHGPDWKQQSLAVPVSVSGPYTGEVDIDIAAPPPAPAFGPVTNGEHATWTVAYFVALAPSTDRSHVKPKDILGVSLDYELLYFSEDATPGSRTASYATEYAVPGKKGYQLSAVYPLSLPARAADRAAFHECGWVPGLCVQQKDEVNVVEYDLIEWNYQQCMLRAPRPESCTVVVARKPTPEQIASSQACQRKITEKGGRGGKPCPRPPTTKPNDKGMNATVTVTLGATLLDAITQIN